MIERFADWGSVVTRPDNYLSFASDTDLAEYLSNDLCSAPIVALTGGDLWRTLGKPAEPAEECLLLPMDVLEVEGDNGPVGVAVAHAIARHRFWQGEFALAMNAAWVRDWYAGPRAHPNDGLVDTTVGSLSLRQRFQARQRIPSGSHLPHPNLTTRRSQEWHYDFARPTRLYLDNRAVGNHRSIRVQVRPNGLKVLI